MYYFIAVIILTVLVVPATWFVLQGDNEGIIMAVWGLTCFYVGLNTKWP